MGDLFSFVGRFHPLIVHFPIGILWLAFFLEILSRFKNYKKVRFAIQPTLILGAVGSLFSALTGYLLSREGGYDEGILLSHQWFGIATAVFSLLTYAFHRWTFLFKEKQRRLIRVIIFIPLLILIIITGHFGGSLTHGDDFLDPNASKKSNAKPISVSSQSIFFENIITPIFEQKCYSCHSIKKQKGQLRLDDKALLLKGGKHGVVLKAALPNESELYQRTILPIDNEHHMPPKGRNQLTAMETKLLFSWINEGASFTGTVGEIKDHEIADYLLSPRPNQPEEQLDEYSIPALDLQDITAAKSKGIMVIPIAQHSRLVKVFFTDPKSITDREFELLKPFKQNIIDLKLSRTSITENAMLAIAEFINLRSLELDFTAITDQGLASIKNLKHLKKLNLVSTQVSNVGLSVINSLPSLRQLYVFKTAITKAGIQQLNSSNLQVDTGRYQLASLKSDTFVYKRSR